MPTGKVKFWNAERGFGFIAVDDGGNDQFVHISNVKNLADLQAGDRVQFEIGMSKRNGKPLAVDVEVTH